MKNSDWISYSNCETRDDSFQFDLYRLECILIVSTSFALHDANTNISTQARRLLNTGLNVNNGETATTMTTNVVVHA